MPEIVMLRASLPVLELTARFLEAIARGADVDLIVEGRRTLLLPGLTRRLQKTGRGATAATVAGLPLFPKVIALLMQARQLGWTWTTRKVQGAREVVIEIRRSSGSVSGGGRSKTSN